MDSERYIYGTPMCNVCRYRENEKKVIGKMVSENFYIWCGKVMATALQEVMAMEDSAQNEKGICPEATQKKLRKNRIYVDSKG